MSKAAKRIALFLLAVVLLLGIVSCGYKASRKEIGRVAVDRRYTAAYDSIETDYQYKYNFIKGEFVLVPDIKTVHHEEVYEVLYRTDYDDGSMRERWETVGKEEWEVAGNEHG